MAKDEKLPSKMHLSHGKYYIVHQNKWIPLSRKKPDALRLYADWIEDSNVRKSEISSTVEGYAKVLEARHANGKLAKKTYENYVARGAKFARVFFRFPHISAIEHADIFEWRQRFELDGMYASWNLTHSYLRGLFEWCRNSGLIKLNPMLEIKKLEQSRRERLITEAEYAAIYEHADTVMRVIMDLADLLGQRIGDVIGIRYEDITETHVLIEQEKTGARLAFRLSDEVAKVIAAAKLACDVYGSKHLFHHTKTLKIGESEPGREMSYSSVYRRWSEACVLAGVKDAHMHDLRAKAATRVDAQGNDAGAVLGHANKATTDIYIRSMMYQEVEPATKSIVVDTRIRPAKK